MRRARRVLLLRAGRVRELLLHGNPVGGRRGTHAMQERRKGQGRGNEIKTSFCFIPTFQVLIVPCIELINCNCCPSKTRYPIFAEIAPSFQICWSVFELESMLEPQQSHLVDSFASAEPFKRCLILQQPLRKLSSLPHSWSHA